MDFKLGTLAQHTELFAMLEEWVSDVDWEERANAETLPLALLLFGDDKPVGTVTLERGDDELAPEVTTLFVREDVRGRGIGQLLLLAAARVAWGSGAERIAARCDAGDLLEKVGFEADDAGEWQLPRPPEPPSFYELVGGEETVRKLVDRFYDLMDELPEASEVREMHAKSLKASRRKLFEFLSGWMGGPNLYIEKHGHPRLRMRHMPFSIGTEARDQWLLCMDQALDEVVTDEEVREQIKDSFARIADHMRNRRGP